MAILNIGSNAAIFSSKANLNAEAGRVLGEMLASIDKANYLYQMVSEASNDDLVAMGFTTDEVSYLKTALLVPSILSTVLNNGTATQQDYAAQLRYVVGDQG